LKIKIFVFLLYQKEELTVNKNTQMFPTEVDF
jgi:hypothetical protein